MITTFILLMVLKKQRDKMALQLAAEGIQKEYVLSCYCY